MPDPNDAYHPINCEFHDVLESNATLRRMVEIRYLDEQGAPQVRQARIVDLPSEGGIEYLQLDSGERIRLDRLQSVGGQQLADYDAAG